MWQSNNQLKDTNVKVRLVAVSQPCMADMPTVKTAEDLIVYCARVSNPANQGNVETGARLLRYCIQHGHWSVFETAYMTLEIQTSRAVAAQILRHRSFTFQEFSQRYAKVTEFEPVELREQGTITRQGGDVLIDPTLELEVDVATYGQPTLPINAVVQDVLAQCLHVYEQLLSKGVAKECARMVLPLCTRTTLYMTGSVRSWIHYLQQRTTNHAQKEHRQVAEAVTEVFKQTWPVTAEALWGAA